MIATSTRYRDANPKTYKAFLDALKEAIDTINKDKRAAAKVYLEQAKDTKNSVDDIFAITNAQQCRDALTALQNWDGILRRGITGDPRPFRAARTARIVRASAPRSIGNMSPNCLKTASNTVAALQITVIAGPIGSNTARPIKIKQYR